MNGKRRESLTENGTDLDVLVGDGPAIRCRYLDRDQLGNGGNRGSPFLELRS